MKLHSCGIQGLNILYLYLYYLILYGLLIETIKASGRRNVTIAWDWKAYGLAAGSTPFASTQGANLRLTQSLDALRQEISFVKTATIFQTVIFVKYALIQIEIKP